jgi:uncharacterized damage-inducible protein DinB
MVVESLRILFNRDLQKLEKELELYKREENIWRVDKEIINPAGNLCLHLVGNLNTYLGATLGNTGYIRNRDLEFSQKGVSRKELLQQIENTILVVDDVMTILKNDQLSEEYPLLVFDHKTTTGYFLIHLATHLSYHLGQVNYHRRLLDN